MAHHAGVIAVEVFSPAAFRGHVQRRAVITEKMEESLYARGFLLKKILPVSVHGGNSRTRVLSVAACPHDTLSAGLSFFSG
jgi:hypothetical protein